MREDQTPQERTNLVGDQRSDQDVRIEPPLLRTTTRMDRTSQTYRDEFQHRRTQQLIPT